MKSKSQAYIKFRTTLVNNQYRYINGLTMQNGNELEIYSGKNGLVILVDYGKNGADVFIPPTHTNNINDTNIALESAL